MRETLDFRRKAYGRGKEHVVFHGKLGSLKGEDEVKAMKAVTRVGWKPLLWNGQEHELDVLVRR